MNAETHSELMAGKWQQMLRQTPHIAQMPMSAQTLLRTFFYAGAKFALDVATAIDEMEDEERSAAHEAMQHEIRAELALNRAMASAAIATRGAR